MTALSLFRAVIVVNDALTDVAVVVVVTKAGDPPGLQTWLRRNSVSDSSW